jgi:hypothetical protein
LIVSIIDLVIVLIDYRCEDIKKLKIQEPTLVRKILGLDSLFETPQFSTKKKKSQEMHLKIPLLNQCLKLSNSKPGYEVSVLYYFGK